MAFYLDDYVAKDEVSHVCLSGGKYWIPKEYYNQLFKYIETNPNKCLAEQLLDTFPLFFDIDDLSDDIKIDDLKEIILKKIKSVLDIDKNQEKCYLTKNKSKSSYHVFFRKIFVTKDTAKQICDLINSKIKNKYNISNVCDVAPYSSGLRMFGTLKYNTKKKEIEKNSKYEFISEIPLKCDTLSKKIKFLCLRKSKVETQIKRKYKKTQTKNIQKLSHLPPTDSMRDVDGVPLVIDKYKDIKHILFKCLNSERYNNYNNWMRVGFILKNSDIPIGIFKKWSKMSIHYKDDEWIEKNCKNIYSCKQKNGHELGLNVLYKYAKYDNFNEFNKIQFAVSKYEKHTVTNDFIKKCFYKEDLGDAELFASLYKKRIICSNAKKNTYHYFDGNLWKEDKSGFVRILISEHLSKLYNQYIFSLEVNNDDDEEVDEENKANEKLRGLIIKRRNKCFTNRHISSILPFVSYLLYDEEILEKFNSNKDVLSIKDGILELKTGELRPRKLEDYCTFELNVDFRGLHYPTDNIETFFQEIMLDNEELVRYLQILLGYCITGNINEQKFIVFWGAYGSNAKSVLIDLIRILMEEKKYYASLSADALMSIGKSSAGTATPHLVPLYGSRIAILDESDKNVKLNEGVVKRITGGSMITIRKLREEEFSFESCCQPILVTNHKPKISDDNAIHRRLILIPFDAQFKDRDEYDKNNPTHRIRDKNKLKKLKECKSELLVWLVKGAIKWYQNNELPEFPDKIKEITDNYKNDSNPLIGFLKQYCEIPSDISNVDENYYFVEESVLLDGYIQYSEEVVTRKSFRENMKKMLGSNIYKNMKKCYNIKYDISDGECLIEDDE